MKNKSIKTQILIPILTLLLFGNILQVIIVSSKSTATANELSTEVIEQTVQDYSNKFQSMASEAYGTLAAFVPVALTMRQGENPREELINNIKGYMQNDTTVFAMWTAWEPNAFDGKDSEYANSSYLDGTGRYVPYLYRSGDDIIMEPLIAYDDAVEGAYYQGVKSSGKPRLTDPYLYSVGAQQVQLYSIALPVFEDGKFIGAIGMDINMETIATNMDVNNILGDGYIFTISPGGLLATHPHEDLILKNYRDLWLIDFDEQLQNLQENKGIITLQGHSAVLDTEVVFSASSVDVGDSIDTWLVCSVVPVKSMTASADAIRTIVITAGALLIVVIAAVTIISLRRALKNMPMLTSVAHTIADGDVMSIALIEDDGCSTRNEVALLMRAFTAMITNIKNQVLALQSIAGGDLTVDIQPVSDKDALNIALRDMVQTNNRVFSEILSASNAVSDVANALSEGSQQLAQAAVEQSASVEELSASITTVAEQAANTESTAKQASDMTKGIMNSAEKGTEKMNEMVQAVLEIGEASNKINNVIMMIEDIASQTNILALNAAVEAARAGQHGKGFAVVAEEVRTLANKSAEAAHDTAKLISESIRKAELGTDLAKESSELLSEIVAGINTTSNTVARIPVATHEQSLSIDQINISIAQISEAVHQSSATSEESAATSEEMSSQAIMLKELVERFKLD